MTVATNFNTFAIVVQLNFIILIDFLKVNKWYCSLLWRRERTKETSTLTKASPYMERMQLITREAPLHQGFGMALQPVSLRDSPWFFNAAPEWLGISCRCRSHHRWNRRCHCCWFRLGRIRSRDSQGSQDLKSLLLRYRC